jgi:hypothetical protein
MEGKKIGIVILYALGLVLALVAIALSYIEVPGDYDLAPLVGFGLLFVAIAGLRSIKK